MTQTQTTGFPKINEGTEEEIIDPALPIVDTLVHLFDRPHQRFMFEDYIAQTRLGHTIAAAVYVETRAFLRATGPEPMRPIGEVEFACGIGAMADSGFYGPCRVAAAIVGYADMQHGAEIAPYLDAALRMAPHRFRGVRQLAFAHPNPQVLRYLTHRPPPDFLRSQTCSAALRELGKRGLSFEATILHPQLPDLCEVVQAHPEVTFVLAHMCLATALAATPESRAAVFPEWSAGLRRLAAFPNVVCKIGGLGTSYWGFPQYLRTEQVTTSTELAADWAPYVETAIEAFGADRCMVASNFPNDGRSTGFVPLWNALKLITRGCSADERAAVFHGTAARVYDIEGLASGDT